MAKLNALTGIRAFAALWVLLLHYQRNLLIFPSWMENFCAAGSFGVHIFFVLSGFILSLNYVENFKNKVEKREYFSFLFNRFARIYPLHFFILFLFLLNTDIIEKIYESHSIFNTTSIVCDFLLLRSWFNEFSMNAVSWSISVELFFYILCPFFLVFLGRLKHIYLVYIFFIFFAIYLLSTVFFISLLLPYGSLFFMGCILYFEPAAKAGE